MTRRPVLAALALPLLFALAACGGSPSGDPTDPGADPTPTPTETEAIETGSIDVPDDTVLYVQGVATATNGATLQLDYVVRKSTAFDDPAGADRVALFLDACAGAYDEDLLAADLFSFALVEIEATQLTGTWPVGEGVYLWPNSHFVALASSGFLVDDSSNSEAPNCKRDRSIVGPGEGTLVIAFRGDTDDVMAAGGFTKWANHDYGFTSLDDSLSLSLCSAIATPLGVEFGWPADAQNYVEDDNCRYGELANPDVDS